MNPLRLFLTIMSIGLPAHSALADNWPAWRGTGGQGESGEKGLPLTWGPKENVRWKVALPDIGNSTPVIWGDRVFLTQASGRKVWPPRGGSGGPAAVTRRSLMCLARADGKLLWQKDVIYDELESTHPTNFFCSASPVTDGTHVVVSFGSAGMYCYDFAGNELWKRDLGKLEHIWGNAASPILHGDLAILWCGPGERQFLLAVNKKTGEKVWEHAEPGGVDGLKKGQAWIGSWSTPIIIRVHGKDQLILGVPKLLKGFDPATGKELWSCAGLGNLVYATPLFAPEPVAAKDAPSDVLHEPAAQARDPLLALRARQEKNAASPRGGILVAMSGFHGPALALQLPAASALQGDITKGRLWHHVKGLPQRVGSGVIVGEHVYILEENGTPHCYELKTGKEVWNVKERPGGTSWSSMVHADGRLYVTERSGTTLVFAARPKYELLAANRLDEHVDASIAVAGGELFIRTHKHLWCIGGAG